MRLVLVGLVLLCALPAAAQEARYRFVWDGAKGHRMRGALAFDGSMPHAIIRESDLTCFEIEGYRDGTPLGRFTLGMVGPDSVWWLHFDRTRAAFLVEGEMGISMPQAWNMNGFGTGCGAGGFGFNIGDYAQDLCSDNVFLQDSGVDPYRPFPAVRDDAHRFGPGACLDGEMLLGAVRRPAAGAAALR